MTEFGDPRLPARFWAKVQVAESGCWEWTGACNSKGYGCTRIGGRTGKTVSTHRLVLDDIPDGMHVDHLCQVKVCCNPAHLEIVTARVNAQRASAKVICIRGHRIAGDNLRISKRGRRQCIQCCRDDNKAYRARRREPVELAAAA
jgi:hypothetical protein